MITKTTVCILIAIAAIIITTITTTTIMSYDVHVQASTLSIEPTPLPINGTVMNLTADDADIDITIDPTDDLPSNGTQSISTAGATDIDINEFPPQGISVVIDNSSITVTNRTVMIGK